MHAFQGAVVPSYGIEQIDNAPLEAALYTFLEAWSSRSRTISACGPSIAHCIFIFLYTLAIETKPGQVHEGGSDSRTEESGRIQAAGGVLL